MDYLDGNLSAAECEQVELFLHQNPEIANQISDFEDVVLSSNNEIIYDRKEELLTATLPNQEFEHWENTHPKLPKTLVSYPHKQRLLKPAIRHIPQWTWYAAACLAIVVLVARPMFETTTENPELPSIAVLPIETITDEPIVIMEMIANDDRRDVLHTPSQTIATNANEGVCNTPLQGTSSSEIVIERIIREHLAITTIQPIHNFQISQETPIIEQIPHSVYPEHGLGIWDDNFIQDDNMETSRRERWNLAVNDRILDPLKTGIHNVVRYFYKRKTDVELFLEEHEMPRFFAQN
jgi:hypothetical protein